MTYSVAEVHKQKFNDDGFVVVEELIDKSLLAGLHQAFDDLFNGKFETGVKPDEVNWQQTTGDPSLTRQICNAGKQIAGLLKSCLISHSAKQSLNLPAGQVYA